MQNQNLLSGQTIRSSLNRKFLFSALDSILYAAASVGFGLLLLEQLPFRILKTYEFGVNSFIFKPVTFDSLVEPVKELGKYWFRIVEVPNV